MLLDKFLLNFGDSLFMFVFVGIIGTVALVSLVSTTLHSLQFGHLSSSCLSLHKAFHGELGPILIFSVDFPLQLFNSLLILVVLIIQGARGPI